MSASEYRPFYQAITGRGTSRQNQVSHYFLSAGPSQKVENTIESRRLKILSLVHPVVMLPAVISRNFLCLVKTGLRY